MNRKITSKFVDSQMGAIKRAVKQLYEIRIRYATNLSDIGRRVCSIVQEELPFER